MGFDTGKLAKQMGKQSPKHARAIDQDPIRVAPHKKPRRYRLELRMERTISEVMSKEFHSKADMQAFRARVQRKIDEQKKAPPKKYAYWWGDWMDYQFSMDSEERKEMKNEPVFLEVTLTTTE